MIVKLLERQDWAKLSEQAHLIVFGENKPAETDRIDFTLMCEKGGDLQGYVTCREHHKDVLYWQYGGMFPGTKGTIKSLSVVAEFLKWCVWKGYKKVFFYVENTNVAMLKMALMVGFRITGIRTHSGSVLLECTKDLEKFA